MNVPAKQIRDSIFTAGVTVSRSNMPWLVLSVILVLTGAILFGIFFGQREAMNLHYTERLKIIEGFVNVIEEKDTQIATLTGAVVDSLNTQLEVMARIEEADLIKAKYLIAQSQRLGIKGPEVEGLREIVERARVAGQANPR